MEQSVINQQSVVEFVLDEKLSPATEIKETYFPFSDKESIVVNNIPDGIRHMNYLSYLALCWKHHYGYVVKPEHIWQIILCEIAGHIKENADKFRDLFTTSAEKKTLTVHSFDPYILPVHSMIDELNANIPSDITAFFPEFSNTSEGAKFACAAAFCDAMSPYYNYGMLMCGLPKCRIEGTVDDWVKIIEAINKIGPMLQLDDYTIKVGQAVIKFAQSITRNSNEHMKSFFNLVRCGSGSQTEVDGWIENFFIKTPSLGYVRNYPSCVSKVEYKNFTTGKEYFLKSGLLRSKVDGDYLVPDFTFVVYEKGTAPAIENKTSGRRAIN
jgi:hypothetical protein